MLAHDTDEPASLSHEPISDSEAMVCAIARGDADAEREFAERYLRPVRAMLLARSRNPDLAADLQQDVLLDALCALRRGQLRDATKLSAFVAAIARNLLNNYFRSQKKTEPLERPDDLPCAVFAFDTVEQDQREARVNEALADLDPLDRTILQLTLVEGLKPGAIAQRLQLSSDMVRQRKVRATRRVTDMIRGQSQTEVPGHIALGKET